MAELKVKVKVRIETDVIMDVGLMAKAFANMESNEQAKFLSMVHREMGEYPAREGRTTMGRLSGGTPCGVLGQGSGRPAPSARWWRVLKT